MGLGWRLAIRFDPEVISTDDASSYRLRSREPFVGPRSPWKTGLIKSLENSRCQCMADGRDNEPSSLSFAKKIRLKDMGGDFW